MPKNITPESGFVVRDELDKIRANPGAYLSYLESRISSNPYEQNGDVGARSNFNATEMAASELAERINPDVCCNGRQLSVIHDDLFTLIEIRSRILGIGTPDPENGVNDVLGNLWNQYKIRLSTLAREMNSYRLACYNCLNDKCEKRNSKHPVADSQKRAYKIIMPSSHDK